MVTFYNIRIEDGMLKANVHNETNGNKESIIASIDGEYHSSEDKEIVKATWSIIAEYLEKNKLPKKTTVSWG